MRRSGAADRLAPVIWVFRLLVLRGVNTLALIVVDWLFGSVSIGRWGSLLVGALVLTIGNAFVKPVLVILTLPLVIHVRDAMDETLDRLERAAPKRAGVMHCWSGDAAQAKQTRRAFLERYTETDTLVCTAHFPLPSAGRIVTEGDTFRFRADADW